MRRVLLLCVSLLCLDPSFRVYADGGDASKNATGSTDKGAFQLNSGFVPNKGQFGAFERTDPMRVLYCARTSGMRVYLAPGGISYVSTSSLKNPGSISEASGSQLRGETSATTSVGLRIDVRFENTNPGVSIETFGRRSSYMNYYLPHNPDGDLRVPEFDHVVYRDLYPGIDLVCTASDVNVQYEFIVHPGADPSRIAMRTVGAENIALDANGACTASTRLGGVHETAPYAYQPGSGLCPTIASRFTLDGSLRGFALGEWDRSRTLIIDPWVTYFGGDADDRGNAATTDLHGNILYGGQSQSLNFPRTTGCFQDTLRGLTDAWYAKFTSGGKRIYTTMYGGTGSDMCYGIATGQKGFVVITGESSGSGFPVQNAFQSTNIALSDIFVVKLDSAGARLWATLIGGNGADIGFGVAIDSSWNVIVAGLTLSNDKDKFKPGFPTTTSAFQRSWGGWEDGCIAKFNTNGVRQYSTYFGGSGGDRFTGIVASEKNSVIVTGRAWSDNFPVTAGSYQTTLAGTTHEYDAVVVRMDSLGGRTWATYFGGTKEENANAISIDRNKNITIVGHTNSTDMPVTTGAQQSTMAGNTDMFATSFTSAGALRWSTYYGGAAYDTAYAVATDTTGAVIVGGFTRSANIPVSPNASQTKIQGGQDGFVVKFDSVGVRKWATYLGGSDDDFVTGITTLNEDVFVIGKTFSSNFPSYSPFQGKSYGSDAFLAWLTPAGLFPVELAAFSGVWTPDGVQLAWSTETETGNAGFEIQRAESVQPDAWTVRGFVGGHATTNDPHRYAYTDEAPAAGSVLYYRLKQIDFDGAAHFSPAIEVAHVTNLSSFAITDVHPNPASTEGTVSVYNPVDSPVEIALYNLAGQQVKTLAHSAAMQVGFHTLSFSVGDVPAGTYFLTVRNAQSIATRQMVIVR